MKNNKLLLAGIFAACLTLSACGTNGNGPSILPTESSTSLPDVKPPHISTEEPSKPDGPSIPGGDDSSNTHTETPQPPEDTSLEIDNNETDVHYLVFSVNATEIARLVTEQGDTYEELEPYFPLISVKGFTGRWPKIDKVWDELRPIITLEARLTAI